MPLCHRCKHNLEIERLRAVCQACRGPSDDFGRHLHMDASAKVLSFVNKNIALDYTHEPSRQIELNGITPKARDELLSALYAFTSLSDCEAVVVRRLLCGERLVDIARTLGLTKQAIQSRWKRILRKGPIFLSLANGLIGKRRGVTKAEREAKAAQRALWREQAAGRDK